MSLINAHAQAPSVKLRHNSAEPLHCLVCASFICFTCLKNNSVFSSRGQNGLRSCADIMNPPLSKLWKLAHARVARVCTIP